MPRSHVCISCGLDLAHQRAALDPPYRLPVVVCPRCGAASVRRRVDSVVGGWRRLARTLRSLALLAVQVILVLVLLLGFGFAAFGIERVAEDVRLAPLRLPLALADGTDLGRVEARERLATMATSLLAGAAAGGAWLSIGFTHLRRFTPWIVWACVLSFFAFARPAFEGLDVWFASLTGETRRYRGPDGDDLAFRGVAVAVWFVLAFALGRPVGRVAGTGLRGLRAAGWRKSYRARRKRRRSDA
ncbi:MAG: hypothetical protein AAF995_11075 [Planctomycetota bacterium]